MNFSIPANVRVLDYLERRGIDLPSFCDGSGVCGRCRIQLIEGELPVTPSDRSFLNRQQLGSGWRLACCAVTQTPVVVDVPAAPKPLRPKGTDRRANAPHRYGLVLCGQTAALCDLTVVTVTDVFTGEEPAHHLLETYPDAAGGLERCLCIGETDVPAISCTVTRLAHSDGSEEDAIEAGIMKLFAERS